MTKIRFALAVSFLIIFAAVTLYELYQYVASVPDPKDIEQATASWVQDRKASSFLVLYSFHFSNDHHSEIKKDIYSVLSIYGKPDKMVTLPDGRQEWHYYANDLKGDKATKRIFLAFFDSSSVLLNWLELDNQLTSR